MHEGTPACLPVKLPLSCLRILCTVVLWFASARADDVYHPLAVGLRWNVDVIMTTPDGKSVESKGTREITGTEVIDGKSYFTTVTRFDGIPLLKPFTSYRRRTAEGILSISASDPEKLEYLECPLPVQIGKTWEIRSNQGKMFNKIEEAEPIVVGNVRYDKCFKVSYRTDNYPYSGYYYLAPNIGNAKEFMKLGEATFVFTLRTLVGPK
jgi:hypothetical protein